MEWFDLLVAAHSTQFTAGTPSGLFRPEDRRRELARVPVRPDDIVGLTR